MILRSWHDSLPILLILISNWTPWIHAKCSSGVEFKRSDLPLPDLLGSSIYALVRPKQPPKTSEEKLAREYQSDALDRLIRCRLNNSHCFRIKPPAPKVEFGKFCWTSQKFEPLRAGISQIRCEVPKPPHDTTVSTFWNSLLAMQNKTYIEVDVSVSNFFLSQAHSSLLSTPAVGWSDILSSPIAFIPVLFGQMNTVGYSNGYAGGYSGGYSGNVGFGGFAGGPLGSGGGLMGSDGPVGSSGVVDPLDPVYPLNPLFPYSPLNPFMHLDSSETDSPLNPDGPFYPLNPASPFSPFNPGNPFNPLSPTLRLPPSDPMSPWNPASPYFPLSPNSPYNPDNPLSPLNPNFSLAGPPPCSPFSPLNSNFLISQHSPWYPLGQLAQISLLPDTHPDSPLNPLSPFNPVSALHAQNPLEGLESSHFLNPLNLQIHPFNMINGEEIPRSLTETSPAYILPSPGAPQIQQSSTPNNGGLPQMLPSEMVNKPARAVGKWFYQFRPAPQTMPVVNPCDPKSPLFAADAYSPFNPFHPSNPYSILNPLNTLPISDPRSPYNPRSSNFAGNPESPYHPNHPMNPFNPDSFVFTCRQTGSLHYLNPRSPFYPLNPRSPYNPANPFSPYNPRHPLLSGLDDSHALNPALRTSPFHPSNRASPYSPENYRKLNPEYKLNVLNEMYIKINNPNDPEPHLGWYNGVKEDFSRIAPPPPSPESDPKEQLIPYSSPKQQITCPPTPPPPPAPQPPYFPGYYQWEPSWEAPRFIRTSNVPTNEPIPEQQWQLIWERLWKLKCKRDSFLAHPSLANDLAIVDLKK